MSQKSPLERYLFLFFECFSQLSSSFVLLENSTKIQRKLNENTGYVWNITVGRDIARHDQVSIPILFLARLMTSSRTSIGWSTLSLFLDFSSSFPSSESGGFKILAHLLTKSNLITKSSFSNWITLILFFTKPRWDISIFLMMSWSKYWMTSWCILVIS